jgi:hypothetical protein
VDLAQLAGEVGSGQVQAVEEPGRRLPGWGLVPDLMACQEFPCHVGEVFGEFWRQAGDEGG